MAYNEFYIAQAGGSDLNAGSTTGAASVTSTNGDWGSVTANRFTPAGGGTPFAAVSVGDWASIYLDAATTLVYLAQVTAVNGGGATLDFSTTAKYGVAPATGSTGRSIKVGGVWATPFAFLGTGVTAVYKSTRINVKAGNYSFGTTTRNFNNTGAAGVPLVWRGYNTTPGDIDLDNSLAKPEWVWGAATVSGTGARQIFLNINWSSTRQSQVMTGEADMTFVRCRFENLVVNANAIAVAVANAAGANFYYCAFKVPSIGARVVSVQAGCLFAHCVFLGGQIGMETTGSTPFVLDHCLFIGQGSHGYVAVNSGTRHQILNCTFKNGGGDGIRFAQIPTAGDHIRGCLFDGLAGAGINNASGSVFATYFADNDFYNCAGGNIVGFGDWPQFFSHVETSSPTLSSTDPTFSGASFAGASARRDFENYAVVGTFFDLGTSQRPVIPAQAITATTIASTLQLYVATVATAGPVVQTVTGAFIGGPATDALLQQDGSGLLQEDGSRLLLDAVYGTSVLFAPTVSAAAVTQSVTTVFLGTGNQRFIPSVAPGAVTVTAVTLGPSASPHVPTVVPGSVAIAGVTVATTGGVNLPTVAVGAVTVVTGTFAPTTLPFLPTVTVGPVTVTGGTVPVASQATAPTTVVVGGVAVLGATVPTAAQPNAPVVTGLLSGSTIGSGSGPFIPTVAYAVTTLHRPTSLAINLPTVVLPAVQPVTTVAIGTGSQLSIPTVAAGPIAFTAATIATGSGVNVATVVPGAVTVFAPTVGTASQPFLPTVAQGAVAVGLPPALISTAQPFIPAVTYQVLAATYASASAATFLPTVIGDRAVTTLVIGTTQQFYAPVVLPIGALGGPTAPSSLSVNVPTVATGPVAVLAYTIPTTLGVRVPSVATLTDVAGATRLSFLQLYVPTIATGPVAVSGQTVPTTGQVSLPTVVVGGTPVSGAFIGTTAQWHAPVLTALTLGATIGTGAQVYTATVLAHQAVTAGTIPVGSGPSTPAVAMGIAGATRPTSVGLSTPAVTVGPVTVGAPTLAAQAQPYVPSIGVGATSVAGASVSTTQQVHGPTLAGQVDLPLIASLAQPHVPVVLPEPKIVTPLWVTTTDLFPPIALPLGEMLAEFIPSGSRVFPPQFVAYAPPAEVHDFVVTLVRGAQAVAVVCRQVDEPVILTRTAAVTATIDRAHVTSEPVVRRGFVMDVER